MYDKREQSERLNITLDGLNMELSEVIDILQTIRENNEGKTIIVENLEDVSFIEVRQLTDKEYIELLIEDKESHIKTRKELRNEIDEIDNELKIKYGSTKKPSRWQSLQINENTTNRVNK